MAHPRGPSRPLLVAAGLLSAAGWLWLLDGGRIPSGLLDWSQEHLRAGVLREALTGGRFPWRVEAPVADPVRFWGTGDLILSPLLPFLPWLPTPAYETLHVLVLFAAGWLGLGVLARRRRWSTPAWLGAALLFFFNGAIVSHIAVGHLPFAGYWLLPWWALVVLDWTERGGHGATAARLALLHAVLYTLGSIHLTHALLLFILALSATRLRWWPVAATTLGLTVALTAWRWLPALVQYGRVGWPGAEGFRSVASLGLALVGRPEPAGGLAPWETDATVGVAGAAWLGWFALRPLAGGAWRSGHGAARPLLFGCTALILLAVGDAYTRALSWVPGLGAERVATRLLLVPLALLPLLAADAATRLPTRAAWGLLLWVAAMAFELARHAAGWRISLLATRPGFTAAAVQVPAIAAGADADLMLAAWLGGVLSLGALFYAVRRAQCP